METIESIDEMRRQLAAGGDIASIRMHILSAILMRLKNQKGPLGDWEKTHFSNAIGALGLNIHSSQQPTPSWLRLCLSDLEKILIPELHDPNFRSPDASMRDVTIAQLKDAVESLIREVNGAARLSVLEASLEDLRYHRLSDERS